MATFAKVATGFLVAIQVTVTLSGGARGASPAPSNPVVEPLNTDLPRSPTIAQTDSAAGSSRASSSGPAGPLKMYFWNWFDRVDAARASQPHWVAPLMTTNPLLVEQFRADFFFQSLGNGARITNLGGGKGLELIPTTSNEVYISVPAYLERENVKPVDGWADWQFLLIKQRLLSANEQDGAYVVTAFLASWRVRVVVRKRIRAGPSRLSLLSGHNLMRCIRRPFRLELNCCRRQSVRRTLGCTRFNRRRARLESNLIEVAEAHVPAPCVFPPIARSRQWSPNARSAIGPGQAAFQTRLVKAGLTPNW
jgi:hypothetical protein